MQTRFDQYAKAVLREALSPSGKVHSEHEIAVAPQRADVYFEPSPQRSPPPPGADVWVLRRIDDLTCLLEHFRETPDLHEVRRCVRKLLSLHHLQCLEAEKQGLPPPPLPDLWVLSPGRPEGVTDGLALTPRPGWPSGFLDGPPALGLHLVVLRELPRTRETLVLRLLAPGPTLDAALEELKRLPPDAAERRVVVPHLLAWRIVTMNDLQPMTMDRLPLSPTLEEIYADWRRKTENDGRRSTLLQQLELRFGALSEDTLARLDSAETVELERWSKRVLTASTLGEVFGDAEWSESTLEEVYAAHKRKIEDDGRRSLLLMLLKQRFGALPDGAMARIEAAETSALERWTRRVLTAATLDDVLGDA